MKRPSRNMLTRSLLCGAMSFGLATGALAQTTPAPATGGKTNTAPAPTAKPPAAPAAKPAAAPAAASNPAPAAAASAGGEEDNLWLKICGPDVQTKKTACMMQTVLRSGDTPIAQIRMVKIEGDKFNVGLFLPINMMLKPGVKVVIDGANKGNAVFTGCQPQPPICLAEVTMDAPAVESLKKAKKFALLAALAGPQGVREVTFEVPLTGFSKAYDSTGIDVGAAQAKQEEINATLQKRAEERRQKLIDSQNAAAKP